MDNWDDQKNLLTNPSLFYKRESAYIQLLHKVNDEHINFEYQSLTIENTFSCPRGTIIKTKEDKILWLFPFAIKNYDELLKEFHIAIGSKKPINILCSQFNEKELIVWKLENKI